MMIAYLYLAAAGSIGCRVVTDDVIRMRDLAAANTAFSSLDADSVVAYSPLPGSVRILQAAQLTRLAQRHGIEDSDFRDICFQRAMRQLGEQELLNALRDGLAIPGAELELVDFSRFPAPVGDLVFPRSGLALTPSQAPLFWKGYVLYGNGHHFLIWARLKVHAKLTRVIATDNLITSKPVRADQVRVETLDGIPDVLAPAQSLDQVVGKNLLRPIRRGGTISLDDVSAAIAIRRGDKVDVDFESSGLSLRLQAAAEMDGRFGDRIRLRNLQSSNIFVAEVTGKDQARVVPEQINTTTNATTDGDETNHSSADLRAAGVPGRGREQRQEEKGNQ
jgi:flagella basal body P-ring formation protein FlgA